ncbi:hypothetical protein ACQPXB_21400 [Amycolatopsis sp. CA-161197]|uniref:hypothetical protein n=1 Tax=Amycolatopsis sp. CA-161197 TaxID=3239922 RepID=UPI003D917B62
MREGGARILGRHRLLGLTSDDLRNDFTDTGLERADFWTTPLINDLISGGNGVIGIGTARRTTVPVILDVRTTAPDDNFDSWDHVTEADMRTSTGRILVSMLNYTPK